MRPASRHRCAVQPAGRAIAQNGCARQTTDWRPSASPHTPHAQRPPSTTPCYGAMGWSRRAVWAAPAPCAAQPAPPSSRRLDDCHLAADLLTGGRSRGGGPEPRCKMASAIDPGVVGDKGVTFVPICRRARAPPNSAPMLWRGSGNAVARTHPGTRRIGDQRGAHLSCCASLLPSLRGWNVLCDLRRRQRSCCATCGEGGGDAHGQDCGHRRGPSTAAAARLSSHAAWPTPHECGAPEKLASAGEPTETRPPLRELSTTSSEPSFRICSTPTAR